MVHNFRRTLSFVQCFIAKKLVLFLHGGSEAGDRNAVVGPRPVFRSYGIYPFPSRNMPLWVAKHATPPTTLTTYNALYKVAKKLGKAFR